MKETKIVPSMAGRQASVCPDAQSSNFEEALNAEERLVKAAFNAVDMALSLEQPVQVIVNGNNASYVMGEKALHESPSAEPLASEGYISVLLQSRENLPMKTPENK